MNKELLIELKLKGSAKEVEGGTKNPEVQKCCLILQEWGKESQ